MVLTLDQLLFAKQMLGLSKVLKKGQKLVKTVLNQIWIGSNFCLTSNDFPFVLVNVGSLWNRWKTTASQPFGRLLINISHRNIYNVVSDGGRGGGGRCPQTIIEARLLGTRLGVSGLKIAGQQAMSGLIGALTGQTFVGWSHL